MVKFRLFYVDPARGSSKFVNEFLDTEHKAIARVLQLEDAGVCLYRDSLEECLALIHTLEDSNSLTYTKACKHAKHYVVFGRNQYHIFEEEISEDMIQKQSPITNNVPMTLIDGKCRKCKKEPRQGAERCINCGQIILRDALEDYKGGN